MPKESNTGFYARFLGGFFLEFEGKRITLTRNLRQKSMQLLLILLKAGEKGVSRKKLTEMLEVGGKSWERKRDNLRYLAYTLRGIIAESGFPEGEYIRVSKGRYYFSLDYPTESDTGTVDRLYQMARKQADPKKQEELLQEICGSYQGGFLPVLMAEEWALVESAHYQAVYSRCLKELCRILKEKGENEKLLRFCTDASRIYPYDEWQLVQIDCLIAEKQYKDARRVCRTANEIFTKELGIAPFTVRIEEMDDMDGRMGKDLNMMTKITDGLEKDISDCAYQCGYFSFIDVFRLMVRMSERERVSLSLLLCTLEPENEGVLLPEQAERFGKLLAGLIRDHDIYTRYSNCQYLVLLVDFGESLHTAEAAGRLRQGWKDFEEKERIKVKLEIQEVDLPDKKEAM